MLSDRAVEIYREMLRRPEWDAEQAGSYLGMDTGQVREALSELTELSLFRESRPVRPELGLNTLSDRQRRLDMARMAVRALAEEFAVVPGQVGVDRLEYTDTKPFVEDMVARAHDDVAICVPSDDAELALPTARARVLYGDFTPRAPSGQARTTTSPPPAMVVCDRSAAVLATGPECALLIRDPALAAALWTLFDLCWRTAVPLGSNGLTEQERQVLTMLAHGATDQTAATRLGLSARSVRRIMAALMDRLGARSRFQAGRLAARRGWV